MVGKIEFQIYSNDMFNDNQYGFIRRKRTCNATIEFKSFIEESLNLNEFAVIVSVDV